ncbi:MAG: gliding motility lipoprotein GldH [Flavobacteriaceae bacterium]|nr:gliding motility lipoprotein GldH [Flavobacteriaceae bacterium]
MKIHKILSIFFVLTGLVACNESIEKVYMKSLNGTWSKKDEQKFMFSINDAGHPKNIILVVRNNNDYPYSNIRFFINFSGAKNTKKETDTLNYVLAKPNGEWLGKGFGDTKETLFLYKLNYKFPENGEYEIGIIQAMRNDNLPGIEDIGVKISNAENE